MTDTETVETTPEDFELFQSECERWIEIYGLKHWDVFFRHEECEGRFAACGTILKARVATITLAKEWQKADYTPQEIKRTAFHEVSELLMAPVNALANHRYVSEDEIEGEIHAVIRTLESVLFPKYPGVTPL